MSNIIYKSSIYIEPINSIEADRIVRDFLCSTCWRHLCKWGQPQQASHINLSLVLCVKCDEDTRGYTHKTVVERRKAEDHFNALEVKRAYPSLDPNPKPKKSAEDNINDLGY